jgi:alpha-D-ribose 1-methylphosphonate 5-triphosphate diphosphatase PhnM
MMPTSRWFDKATLRCELSKSHSLQNLIGNHQSSPTSSLITATFHTPDCGTFRNLEPGSGLL